MNEDCSDWYIRRLMKEELERELGIDYIVTQCYDSVDIHYKTIGYIPLIHIASCGDLARVYMHGDGGVFNRVTYLQGIMPSHEVARFVQVLLVMDA
jgi:hypothetical protein